MAIAKTTNKSGIVVRNAFAKESDAMVTVLSSEGFFSFYARGIGKFTSKNRPSCELLSEATFSLREANDGSLSLTEASLERSYFKGDDYDACLMETFLLEVTNRLVQEEDGPTLFPWLRVSLNGICEGKDPYTIGLLYLANVLRVGGIGLETSHCVICGGKSTIRSVSYEDGGFVCANCFSSESMSVTPEMEKKIIRYIFMAPLSDIGRVTLEEAPRNRVYRNLIDYIEEMTGVKIRSLDLLKGG